MHVSDERKTITREELYEQLWKVPISRLTIGLGYSYTELVKICAELKIPRPTGGYWYRLQHGGESEKIPLPSALEGTRSEIPLGPRLSKSGEQLPATALVSESNEEGVPAGSISEDSAPLPTSAEKILCPGEVPIQIQQMLQLRFELLRSSQTSWK